MLYYHHGSCQWVCVGGVDLSHYHHGSCLLGAVEWVLVEYNSIESVVLCYHHGSC